MILICSQDHRFPVTLPLQKIPNVRPTATEKHETPIPQVRHKNLSHSSSPLPRADTRPPIQAPQSLNPSSFATTSYSEASPPPSDRSEAPGPILDLDPVNSELPDGSPKSVRNGKPRGSKQSTRSSVKVRFVNMDQ